MQKPKLAAAAVLLLTASAAHAQFTFPAVTITGIGSPLLAPVLRQGFDCYGLKQSLVYGVASPRIAPPGQDTFDYDFNPATADNIYSRFNCAGNSANALVTSPNFGVPRIVQPGITVRYVSYASGLAINGFLANRLPANTNISAQDGPPPVVLQFALSEVPLTSATLQTYNTTPINPFNRYPLADTAANLFGPAIQVPLIVVPITIAYDPVYAKERNGGGFVNEYRFQVAAPRADGSGGLRLTRAQYCGIVNGVITNWNQLPAAVVRKDPNDPTAFDVPIRLVGGAESSGETSIFTRAMAAQCSGLTVNTGIGGVGSPVTITNKFGNAESRLPYDGTVSIPNTAYIGAGSIVSPINAVSGAFFDKSTGIVASGSEQPGLFGIAEGADGVAAFLNYHPDPGATVGSRTVNGRIGYVGSYHVLPATLFTGVNSYGLNTASLQQNGTGTVYLDPNGTNAINAFNNVPPPQSKGMAGAYDSTVTATNRANPLDWVARSDKSVQIANPAKGYPITGTVNALIYTCFADPASRQAVTGLFALFLKKGGRDFNNQQVAPGLLNSLLRANGAGGSTNAYIAQSAAYQNAISETFLKSSLQLGKVGDPGSRLGLRNLWIQDKLPTTPTGTGAVTSPNPLCAGKPGA